MEIVIFARATSLNVAKFKNMYRYLQKHVDISKVNIQHIQSHINYHGKKIFRMSISHKITIDLGKNIIVYIC